MKVIILAKSVNRRSGRGIEVPLFQKYIQSFLSFWNEFKQFKGGVFGIAIILGYFILSLAAPLIAEPHPNMYRGEHPPLAAPIWMSNFDPNYFPDQYPINHEFSNLSELDKLTITYSSSSNLFSVNYYINPKLESNGALVIEIKDDITKSASKGDSISVVIKQSFTWKFGKPPNLLKTLVAWRGNFTEVDNTTLTKIFSTLSSKPYIFEWNAYIGLEGMPLNELVQYVEEHSGVTLIPGTDYDSHGLFLGSLKNKDISLGLVESRTTMQKEIANAIFQKGNKIYIELVLTFKINNPSERPDKGAFQWIIDKFIVIGHSYYYGLMGTNEYGADIFSLIVDGIKISLFVGITAATLSIAIGVTIGLVAGYYGGKVDEILMRFVDVVLSMPGLPLLIVLVFILDQSGFSKVYSILIALVVFGWVGPTRVIRSQVLVEKSKEYIEAAKINGASNVYIIFRHILPNVFPLVFIYIMTGVTGAILSEAGLSFLGLGPDWNSLGKILQMASIGSIQGGGGGAGFYAWWYIFFPGLILALLGIAFMYIGFTLERIFNPRLRGR